MTRQVIKNKTELEIVRIKLNNSTLPHTDLLKTILRGNVFDTEKQYKSTF